jgi:exosortase
MIAIPSKKYGLAIGLLLGVILWAYWPTLVELSETWSRDAQYSHGFIVPIFALVILYLRRDMLDGIVLKPTWWAMAFLAMGAGAFLVGGYFYSPWLVQNSLLPILAGIVVALGGLPLLRWSWPSILFLAFMIPLPDRVDQALIKPLQTVATLASTNALQTLGVLAQSEGNIIVLPDGYEMGIAEACSGLRMLMVFVATSMAIAMIIQRPLLQKILIVLSSFPIAILCNVIRITATGILHETAGHEIANRVFHDVAGWLMSPLALLFLAGELWVLRRTFIPVGDEISPITIHQRSINVLGSIAPAKAGTGP